MTVKVKIYKCKFYHNCMYYDPLVLPHQQSFWHHWQLNISRQGTYVFKCKQCIINKKNLDDKNKKTLPDEYVLQKLLNKSSLKPDDVPEALIETKRATMKLQYFLTHPVKECARHGKLFLYKNQVVKCGVVNGVQRYKCRLCQKERQADHYVRNKELVRQKHKIYREANQAKRCISHRKSYLKYKDSVLEKQKKYRDENKDIINAKEREKTKKLDPAYVRELLVRRSRSREQDIPPEIIQLKSAILELKRKIKLTVNEDKINSLLEKMNDIEN